MIADSIDVNIGTVDLTWLLKGLWAIYNGQDIQAERQEFLNEAYALLRVCSPNWLQELLDEMQEELDEQRRQALKEL